MRAMSVFTSLQRFGGSLLCTSALGMKAALKERVHERVRCDSPKPAHLVANTGSECADAGALSHPRVNVCACGCPCRSSGRP